MITQKSFTIYECIFLGGYVLYENLQWILVNPLFCCKGLLDVTTLVHGQILTRIIQSWNCSLKLYNRFLLVWEIGIDLWPCQVATTFNHYNARFYTNKTMWMWCKCVETGTCHYSKISKY